MRLIILLVLTIAAGAAAFFNKDKPFTVTSSAFVESAYIPVKYTCKGENASPGLLQNDLPENTKSVAIIMDDPDAKQGTFVHWVVWNLPAVESITENTASGVRGKNGKGEIKYTGPCPPDGMHRYFFKVYALDGMLTLPEGSDKKVLEKAMKTHIIAEAQLMGLYKK
jgi:Raf kinase inhibitor-like YbhB/YbcL family protein